MKKDHWLCESCDVYIEPEEVTYEETHDPRHGGCGESVEWLEESEDPE